MAPDPDEPLPTSFSSVPKSLIEEVRKIVEPKGVTALRPVYEEAITRLCDELDGGLVIDVWPASRPGLAGAKETVRLSPEVTERMNRIVRQHNTRKGIFFRVALVRWLVRQGVDYPL